MTGRLLCPALLLGALFLTSPVAAQNAAPQTPQTEEQLKAQQHFQRAKELYSQGKYTDAVQQLELARNLDPKAKDLVFNLGIVHEKLGKFDEAIAFFRQYMEMEGVTAQERAKAETNIKRIEGAKQEVASRPPPSGSGDPQSGNGEPGPKGPQLPEEKPPHGRIDGATIAAGSIAIAGLGVGTVFGLIAVTSKPNDFVTGRDGTYAQFEQKNADAHNAAIVADIGLAVGIVATLATAYLYFGRTKDPQRTSTTGFVVGPGMVAGTFR
jgi:tetratricopeptide (TPR) repeat protein